MKTYTVLGTLLACLVFFSCSTSEGTEGEGSGNDDDSPIIESNYTLLLEKDGVLTSILLNVGDESLGMVPAQSPFEDISFPRLAYKEGSVLSLYQDKGDCQGEIVLFDFSSSESNTTEVFPDLVNCELAVHTIAHFEDRLYIGYEVQVAAKEREYYVRVVGQSDGEPDFMDVALEKKPLQLVHENNRLFILVLDEEVSRENALVVMDCGTNQLVHEMNLGFNARQLFKTPEKNIIVSYDDLHTEINSSTLAHVFIRYTEGSSPNFFESGFRYFDSSGQMYYEMLAEDNSIYPMVPAVYNFDAETAVLYAFENFLTEAQRDFELEIENTTMVGYDEGNNTILIGYKKTSGDNKGGLLRIQPVPDPKYLDNLDLDGTPYLLFKE